MRIIVFTLLLFASNLIFGQVSTKRVNINELKNRRYLNASSNTPNKKLPNINVEALKEEDKNEKPGMPPRFAKAVDVNYRLKDGIWIKTDSGKIWSLQIESEGFFIKKIKEHIRFLFVL